MHVKKLAVKKRILASCVCCLWACAGCGSKQVGNLPTTFPVAGTVVDHAGQPLSGGSIEFEAKDDPNLLAVGNLQDDGSFVLTTYLNGEAAEGAVGGEHRVTIYPAQVEHGASEPIQLRELQRIDPGKNELSIALPRQRR